jgi:uncharacterized repeat protein (TIGR03843 family)
MVQLWIGEDEAFDMVAAINDGGFRPLQRIALLDAVLNNSDRKVSHLLPVAGAERTAEPHIYGVDHGVSLGVQNRLRTVLWQWAGKQIPEEGLEVLGRLDTDWETGGIDRPSLAGVLSELLTTAEVRAVRRRVQRLLGKRKFPLPPTDWPAIPYPPY